MPDHKSTLIEDSDYHGNKAAHESFDFEGLDSIEDQVRECLAQGRDVSALVQAMVDAEVSEVTSDALARVLCLLADARKPKMVIDHIAYAFGLPMAEGKSAAALARKHGVRKQAFSQAVKRIVQAMGIRPSRAMRSLKGRKAMAEAYRKRAEKSKA